VQAGVDQQAATIRERELAVRLQISCCLHKSIVTAVNQLIKAFGASVLGVASGFDRVVFQGMIRPLMYPQGAMGFFQSREILFKDAKKWVLLKTAHLASAVEECSLRECGESPVARPLWGWGRRGRSGLWIQSLSCCPGALTTGVAWTVLLTDQESAMSPLLERYRDKIRGVLGCFDRVIITGSLPDISYADAMTRYLRHHKIPIFQYTQWAERLRDQLRDNASRLAKDNDLEIEYLGQRRFRKEERVKQILAKRGNHPGLVHIFSAVEPCSSYRPWHDKKTSETFLKPRPSKCLHYYFYFVLPELGLCYLRVPTWAPFRLQFYFNGHNYLAAALQQEEISYELVDNAFFCIEDFPRAQELADALNPKHIHRLLNQAAQDYCPVLGHFRSGYHWSLMQVEYATDIVFRRRQDLEALYETLTRTAIHAVKAEHVATFLGRKLTQAYEGELGNDFHTRIEGTRIKHQMGRVSIKMYDKRGLVLRIETTANDVSFFKHRRKVVHRDGSSEIKLAPLRKTLYSLPALQKLMAAANRRYLEFLSTLEDPTVGLRNLLKISKTVRKQGKSFRGFNLFAGEDLTLFRAIVRGEFNISGFQNRNLRAYLKNKTSSQVGRLLKRLRNHGLLKKVPARNKYYLTRLGRRVVATALKLRELYLIPALATT
jgi:hypothetical protein